MSQAAAIDTLVSIGGRISYSCKIIVNDISDARDSEVAKSLKLRSWDNKKVCGIVNCYNCGKSRCLFTPLKNDEYARAQGELQRTLESVDYRFSCGDLIFSDEHPSGKTITQRLNLTCESRIETAYYNVEGRGLKTKSICIHCGEHGDSDFLYQQEDIEAMNKSGGKQCYPICKLCLGEGKKVIHYAGKKTDQAQKRKEDYNNKNAEASKRRRKNS